MGTRENKDLLRQLHEEGFSGSPDRLGHYFLPSYVDHVVFKNLAGLKTALKAFHAAYPNAIWRAEDMIAEGDRVAVRSEMRIPSALGQARVVTSTVIYRFENGKIAESWGNSDPV